ASIGLEEARDAMQKARALLDLVEHEGEQHEVAALRRQGNVCLAGLDDANVGQPVLGDAALDGAQHLALHVRGEDVPVLADDLGGGNGEETWAAADVGDGVALLEAEVAQERLRVERLITLLAEQ